MGIALGSISGIAVFIISLKEDYPPILKDLEKTNNELKDPILEKIYGNRDAQNFIKKIDGVSEHRNILKDILDQATKNIIIFSGFTSKYAIDEIFLTKIKKALEKGVNIYLCFGYQHPSNKKSKTDLSKKEITELIQLSREVKEKSDYGKLIIYDIPNHSKMIIKDQDFMINGSFNWLSTGDESKNFEQSFLINNKRIINDEVTNTFNLFSKYQPL